MTAAELAARAELDELYAQLPALECKGLCADSCTVAPASELERRRVAERGVQLPIYPGPATMRRIIAGGDVPRCPALSPLNTCQVHDVRPFTCRAFGVTADPRAARDPHHSHRGPMMCDHGCVPDATISLAEYARVILAIETLSVEITGVRRDL